MHNRTKEEEKGIVQNAYDEHTYLDTKRHKGNMGTRQRTRDFSLCI